MNITVGPRGILQIDNARIVYRNFSGRGDKFNREGDRNFSLFIDTIEDADALSDAGWNVKMKEPRIEGEMPFIHLPVKVKFNDRGPNVYLESSGRRVRLTEDTISCLDNVDIANVDLDIRPYDWDVNGKTGRTAYLHAMCVTQNVDRFAMDFAYDEYPEE